MSALVRGIGGATQQSASVPRSDPPCRLVEWKPWPFSNPSLLGHCTVAFAGGWVVHKIPIFRTKDGSISCGVPNAAEIDGEGRIKERDGKKQYISLISFEGGEAKERWRRSILGALATAGIVP
jgi:hypothetical protein